MYENYVINDYNGTGSHVIPDTGTVKVPKGERELEWGK